MTEPDTETGKDEAGMAGAVRKTRNHRKSPNLD